MRDRHPREAPDYTDAALVSGLACLVWLLFALWASVGFWAVLAAGAALNHLITRLARRRR